MFTRPRRGLGLVIGVTAFLAFAGPSSAAPPGNDLSSNAAALRTNVGLVSQTNVEATSSSNEPFTAFGPFVCDDTSAEMGSTVWYRVPGTGGPILVSVGGPFDTLTGVYDAGGFSLFCDDDSGPGTDSYLRFQSTAGASHLIQVGGLDTNSDGIGQTGLFNITALTNDDRAFPETVLDGSVTKTNIGATEESGEVLSCNGRSFHSTVWFRYVAPDLGTVTFRASRLSLALAIYRGGALARCNTSSTGTELSVTDSIAVRAGEELLVQVGGLLNPGEDNIDYSVSFDVNCDGDGDGTFDANRSSCRGTDCNDANAGIKPGVPDIVNNAVDENCDGYRDFDRDGDRYLVTEPVRNPLPNNWDCNDANPRIHPGARDVPGNRLNEDCVGRPRPAGLIPTTTSINYAPAGAGLRPTKLVLKRLLKGSRVVASCKGVGCPPRGVKRKIKRRTRKLSLVGAFRNVRLRTGSQLQVKVLPPNFQYIGKIRTDSIARGLDIKTRERCVTSRGRVRRCPR